MGVHQRDSASCPYGNQSMVANLKQKGIDGKALPGMEPVTKFYSAWVPQSGLNTALQCTDCEILPSVVCGGTWLFKLVLVNSVKQRGSGLIRTVAASLPGTLAPLVGTCCLECT